MIKWYSFISSIFLFPAFIQAQSADSITSKVPIDYIQKMDQYLAVKFGFTNDVRSFTVKNSALYKIYANDKTNIRLSANYRWLSASVSLTPKFIPGNNDNSLKGNTEALSFGLGFNFNNISQTLSYARVHGYYLHNTEDFEPTWRRGADPYIQYPDLVYYGYFGRTTYKFNKKFSFSALTAQTQRQLKSVGTFIPSLSYNYYIIDNDEILTGQNGSLKSKNLELLLSAGYYQTFIMHDHFYFSMGLVPGVGLITTKAMKELSSETVTDRYVNVIYRLEASSAFGYNAERLFFGAQLTAAASGYDQYITSNVIISNQLYYQVFAGYRFSAPDFLKNLLDKIESKTGRVLGRRGRH